MDISSWTSLTKYPLQEHQLHITMHTESTAPDQALDTTRRTDKEETGLDHSLDTADIAAPATVTYTETTPDHNNGRGKAAIGAAQNNPFQCTKDTVADPTMTHHTGHIANHPHTAAHQVTPLGIAIDHINANPTDCQNIIHTKEDHTPIREPKNHTLVGIGRSI